MKFSPINENFIKCNLENKDELNCINELTKKIEKMELEMKSELNTGYLNVINKCSKLELLSTYIETIQNTNANYFKKTHELILRSCDVSENYNDIKRSIDRLEKIKQEFLSIEDFLKRRCDENCGYFETVQNLKSMENTLIYFKKYNFYLPLNQIYKDMYVDFISKVKNDVHKWLESLDYLQIGMLIVDLDYKFKIFNDIYICRDEIITKIFLKINYVSKKLEIDNLITETIDSKRLELGFTQIIKTKATPVLKEDILENIVNNEVIKNENKNHNTNESQNSSFDNKKNEINSTEKSINKEFKIEKSMKKEFGTEFDTIPKKYEIKNKLFTGLTDNKKKFYILAANILVSHFVKGFFVNIQSFYNEIYDEIDLIDFEGYDMLCDTLIPLKRLITALNLDSDQLDSIIEKATFIYFSSYKSNDDDLSYLISFIDGSIKFLKEISQFNNELDELLVQKIDKILLEYYEEKNIELEANDFIILKNDILKIINHLKKQGNFYETKYYEIENKLFYKENEFIDNKANEILKDKNIKIIIQKLIELKKFMKEKTRNKVIQKIKDVLLNYYTEDDLELFKDTIKRNFNINE